MNHASDPFKKYLGVSQHAPPSVILGLPPEDLRIPARIQAALQRRIRMVNQHPDAQHDDAQLVRDSLRRLAEQTQGTRLNRQPSSLSRQTPDSSQGEEGLHAPIKPRRIQPVAREAQTNQPKNVPSEPQRPNSSTATRPQPELTEFDVLVISVLVAAGGWNHQSRAQLVALAREHQISNLGLLRMVTGLAHHAREFGAQITLPQFQNRPVPFTPADELKRMRELRKSQLQEHKKSHAEARSKYRHTIVAGLCITGILIISSVLLVSAIQSGVDSPPTATELPSHEDATQRMNAGFSANSSTDVEPLDRRMLVIDQYPTFQGNTLPISAVQAADRALVLRDSIERQVNAISIGSISEQTFRIWDQDLQEILAGWQLMESSVQDEILGRLNLAFLESAIQPQVTAKLFEPLYFDVLQIQQPIDIWKHMARVYILRSLQQNEQLSTSIREQVNVILESAIHNDPQNGDQGSVDERALQQMVPEIIALTNMNASYADYWETWIAGVQQLHSNQDKVAGTLFLDAIDQILRSPYALESDRPIRNVLGRMVLVLAADPPPATAQWIYDAHLSEEKYSTESLWVLTSLLVHSRAYSWLNETHVTPVLADNVHRRRMADRIRAAWPEDYLTHEPNPRFSSNIINVQNEDVVLWQRLLYELRNAPRDQTSESDLKYWLALSRINWAATLIWNQQPQEARNILENLIQNQSMGNEQHSNAKQGIPTANRGPAPANPALRPGKVSRAIGADGVWAEQFRASRNNTEEKLRLLRVLRSSGGGDLAPLNAEQFVREVYLGSPIAVRSLAQSITREQFRRGRNIVQELLDQYPIAPKTENVALLIQAVTGTTIPFSPSQDWQALARHELIKHAIRLHEPLNTQSDIIMNEIVELYGMRVLAENDSSVINEQTTMQQMMELSSEWWMLNLTQITQETVASSQLSDVRRRHRSRLKSVQNEPQRIVAWQIFIAELMSMQVAMEFPEAQERLQRLMQAESNQRAKVDHIHDQLWMAERWMTSIWEIRFDSALRKLSSGEQSS